MKKEQTIARVNSQEMSVSDFRKKYVSLGQEKADREKELVAYAEKFLKETYNTELTVPIKISGRLTSTGGYFQYRNLHGNAKMPLKIDISERFIASASNDGQEGIEAVLDTLKHELVHYALCKQGKDFSDGDYEFESELARLNIGASGATNEKLVKSKKPIAWYKVIDIYEQYSFDLIKEEFVKYETYKKHSQKPAHGNRVAYEVVKSYL